MGSGEWLGLLAAIFAGSIASVITAWVARPKTRAEATAANSSASVGISGDARQWAQFHADRAERAEIKADIAEKRLDALERHFGLLVTYNQRLQAEVQRLGGHVPPLPEELRKL